MHDGLMRWWNNETETSPEVVFSTIFRTEGKVDKFVGWVNWFNAAFIQVDDEERAILYQKEWPNKYNTRCIFYRKHEQ